MAGGGVLLRELVETFWDWKYELRRYWEWGWYVLLNSRSEEVKGRTGRGKYICFLQIIWIWCRQLNYKSRSEQIMYVWWALPSVAYCSPQVQLRSMPSSVIYLWNYIALPQVTFYFYFISSPRSSQWKQKLFPHGQLPFDTHSYKWKEGRMGENVYNRWWPSRLGRMWL